VPFSSIPYEQSKDTATLFYEKKSGSSLVKVEGGYLTKDVWEDVKGSGEVYSALSAYRLRKILQNHVISEVLLMYYRTLCGINFDEQSYTKNNLMSGLEPSIYDADFTSNVNIDADAFEFLLAANVNLGPSAPSSVTEPPASILPTGPHPMESFFHGTSDPYAPDPDLPPLFQYDKDWDAGLTGILAPKRVKRMKKANAGLINGKSSENSPAYPAAAYNILKSFMQSGAFQSTNIAVAATTVKEFDRVFALPVDVDEFIVSANNNLPDVIDKYLNADTELGSILIELPDDHPAWKSYPELQGTGLYKLNYTSPTPQPVGNPQDFVFADQFFAQFALIETPGAGEGVNQTAI